MKFKKNLWVIVLLCTIALNILITINTDNLTMTYFLSLVVTLIYLKLEVGFLTTTFFFTIFYIMLFYLQPILHLTFIDYLLPYPQNIHQIYSIITITGIHLFQLGHCLFSKRYLVRVTIKEKVSLKKLNYFKNMLAGLITLYILLVILQVGPSAFLTGSRLGMKQSLGLVGLGLHYLGYIVSFLIFMVFLSYKKRRKSLQFIIWIIYLGFIVLFFVIAFRIRSFLIGHFLAALMGVYFSDYFVLVDTNKEIFSKVTKLKESFKKLKILFSMGIILVVGISFRFLRGYLEPHQSVSNFNFDLRYFIELSITAGDLGYAYRVYELINQVPENFDLLFGQSYYRLLMVVIPSFLWLNKPPTTERIVASWLDPGVIGLTLPPGINGDFYINFGIAGVFLMILFGIFFARLDSEITYKKILIWSSSPVWIFHLVRGSFTNPLVIYFVILLVSSFLSKKCIITNNE